MGFVDELDKQVVIERVAIAAQDLSSGPFSLTSAIGSDFRLVGIYLKADGTINQNVSLSLVFPGGLEVERESANTQNDSSFVFEPNEPQMHYRDGTEFKVMITNNGTPSVEVEGFYEFERI